MSKYTDVMIDLETLGVKPGCAILSIGAVPFGDTKHRGLRFYKKIFPSSNDPYGLTSSKSTLEWWDKQTKEARIEAFSGTFDLSIILREFSTFLEYLTPEVRVWGNAASFDLKILERAYEACAIPVPWDYRNEMCYRTLKNLHPTIKASAFVGIKHSALADAEHQATHAEEIIYQLRLRGMRV